MIDQRAPMTMAAACILLVEDEFLIRMAVGDSFRDAGFEVVEAFNGDEAIDVLMAGKPIDVILSDVHMPGSVDGIGLLRFVRANFPHIPTIIASGRLESRVALAEGAIAFLSKPYLTTTALEIVANQLERRP